MHAIWNKKKNKNNTFSNFGFSKNQNVLKNNFEKACETLKNIFVVVCNLPIRSENFNSKKILILFDYVQTRRLRKVFTYNCDLTKLTTIITKFQNKKKYIFSGCLALNNTTSLKEKFNSVIFSQFTVQLYWQPLILSTRKALFVLK